MAGGGGGDVDSIGGAEIGMIPKVLTDAGKVFEDGDAGAFEDLARAYSGDHEELGGLEGAGRDYDFFLGFEGVVDARGAVRPLGIDRCAGGSIGAVKQNLLS